MLNMLSDLSDKVRNTVFDSFRWTSKLGDYQSLYCKSLYITELPASEILFVSLNSFTILNQAQRHRSRKSAMAPHQTAKGAIIQEQYLSYLMTFTTWKEETAGLRARFKKKQRSSVTSKIESTDSYRGLPSPSPGYPHCKAPDLQAGKMYYVLPWSLSTLKTSKPPGGFLGQCSQATNYLLTASKIRPTQTAFENDSFSSHKTFPEDSTFQGIFPALWPALI